MDPLLLGAVVTAIAGVVLWVLTNWNIIRLPKRLGIPRGTDLMQLLDDKVNASADRMAARFVEALPEASVRMWDALAPRLAEAMPSFAVAFQPALVEAAEGLAPVLTDALVKHGAELMAGKSNAVQSMAKQALGDVDLQQILGSPEVQGLLKSAGQGGGPLASLGAAAGNPLAALAPRVMKYLPKDLQALAPLFLQGLGRGGSILPGNGGSGSYSPGLPGRDR